MDSELIEKARKAISDARYVCHVESDGSVSSLEADDATLARAALAVFEAAHAKELDTSPERVKNGPDSLHDAAQKPDHHVDHHEDEREALIEDRKAVLAVLNQSPALPLDVVSAQIMMVLMDRGFRRPVSGGDYVPGQR